MISSREYKNDKQRRINYAALVNHKPHALFALFLFVLLLFALGVFDSKGDTTEKLIIRESYKDEYAELLQENTRLRAELTEEHQSHGAESAVESERRENSIGDDDVVPANENMQQKQIVEMFKHAWKGYVSGAWGKDELKPVSQTGSNWFGLGLTLIDALDTMLVMGLTSEFDSAREWVATSLEISTNDIYVNVFETTIRVLGGLLSTYAMTGDVLFKDRAIELADCLLPAFDTNTGIPLSDVNLETKHAKGPKGSARYSSLSEATTVQIEFKYLSWLTGDPKYREAVEKASTAIENIPKVDGLAPMYVNIETATFKSSTITLGARGDSYYEYLLKQWLISDKTETNFLEAYEFAVDGIVKNLVKVSEPKHLVYIAEKLNNSKLSNKMDHLVCFLPGVLALGHIHGAGRSSSILRVNGYNNHLHLAEELIRTCNEMYASQPLHLAPEIVHFNDSGMIVKKRDSHCLLRPETVESLFIMYRVTKDEKYRQWGWSIFEAIEEHAKVESGGYSSIKSVSVEVANLTDKMESFFLAETLKYLYLLFSDDPKLLPLDVHVFNTEAHPLPVFRWTDTPGKAAST